MGKLHIKKGDTVVVIAGEDKGHQGKVLLVDIKKQTAIVEGGNLVSKHTRPSTDNPKGGIIKKEAPIHVSNLMLLDSKGKASRIGRKKDEKTGKTVRYSKKSGEVIK
ncbi:MAG: 50S ribosomal protein L24 [Bacteroidales bacterium]|jgi:large subunit ribosomal protein L24|nr:50S ribosomal protein L24 [Bacteroidales bacterium]MCK9449202.1 50S ribosomal protein L24 [Bacteroidales bacterium]MDD3701760.1 50S ribosomal protein L24 [Bacteroidales bacterium]MDY0370141.1 50S ribosomal protein L24 [Bacteroidales bacterium]